MDMNKRFAELAGICNHSGGVRFDGINWTCEDCGSDVDNDGLSIDYSDPIKVLRVMMEREDWPEWYMEMHKYYLIKSGAIAVTPWVRFMMAHARDERASVPIPLLLTPGALRDRAIEYLTNKKGE